VTDWLVPVLLAALSLAEILSFRPDEWLAAVGVETLACVCLAWRRTHTLVACVAAAWVSLSVPWFGPQLDELATPIFIWVVASYSLARWLGGYRGISGLGLILLVVASLYFFEDQRDHNVTDVVFVLSLMVPPYVFGRLARKFAEQADELERQQEYVARAAVRAERDRIAREMHDVIAHSISAMVVQTAAAQDLVRSDPDRAMGLLESTAEVGRQALTETGRLLHLIRDDSDELGLSPAPGLADLPALLETFRSGGLEVDATIQVASAPLAAGVDVSAYRVVQEALTNALKYGDGGATLSVNGTASDLHIRATNRLHQVSANGSGLGLLGMAERVSMLGGRISHGTTDGQFVLDVVLPVAIGGAAR
jgi:signal transduction histidine kinase